MTNNGIENAIAISAEFHTARNYQNFYMQFGDRLNGFTGIYDLIARMAQALTDWENENPGVWEDRLDWPEVTESYASGMINRALESGAVPDEKELLMEIVNPRA